MCVIYIGNWGKENTLGPLWHPIAVDSDHIVHSVQRGRSGAYMEPSPLFPNLFHARRTLEAMEKEIWTPI